MRALLLVSFAACGDPQPGAGVPWADAGFDQVVQVGETVTLRGRAEPAADAQYAWELVLRPAASSSVLSAGTGDTTTFVADRPGTYVATLVVRAGELASEPDVVAVTASNQRPVATASCAPGSGCDVLHARSATLHATGTDPDGDTVSFAWTQVRSAAECSGRCPELASCNPVATALALIDATAAIATFTAPQAKNVEVVFAVVVSDGVESDTACVRYDVINTPPQIPPFTASPGTVNEGAQTLLDTSAGDSDPGDPLTFQWEQCEPLPASCQPLVSAPPATIHSPNARDTLVTTPAVSQQTTLYFRLTASDGLDSVTSPLVSVVVRNL